MQRSQDDELKSVREKREAQPGSAVAERHPEVQAQVEHFPAMCSAAVRLGLALLGFRDDDSSEAGSSLKCYTHTPTPCKML